MFSRLSLVLRPRGSLLYARSDAPPTVISRTKIVLQRILYRFYASSSEGENDGPIDTKIRFFNSLSGKKEALVLPTREHVLKWYTCGPTVYDHAHIGHARNYVQIDIIIRILEHFFHIPVDHVLGMTNVDDKIIARAKEAGIEPAELAYKFECDFWEDMQTLGVSPPSRVGRVTDHLQEIVDFIQVVLGKGLAYVSNGSVYFDSVAFGDRAGKLNPHMTNTEGVSYDSGDAAKDALLLEKRNPRDFALWKKSKAGEVGWASPFSDVVGRPGWHIECSTVATKQLGSHLDVHAGGIDLLFPHHNNEICQCDAYFGYDKSVGPQWVRIFVHTGHLHIHGHKMSKSLKNFITIKEFLKTCSPTSFRLFCLSIPYYSNVDYNADRVQDAKNVQIKYHKFFTNVQLATEIVAEKYAPHRGYERKWNAEDARLHALLRDATVAFRERLEDNFDTPEALRILNEVMAETNQYMQPALTRTGTTQNLAAWPHSQQLSLAVASPSLPLVSLMDKASEFVSTSLALFGIDLSEIMPLQAPSTLSAVSDSDHAEAAVKLIGALRQNIRQELRKGGDIDKGALFKEMDRVRDDIAPALGYALRDTADGGFILERKPSTE